MILKRYILTGAPGSGKTSVLRFLETLGYSVVDEAATDVIALEQALGHDEPWSDPQFMDQIVALQRRRQIQASCVAESVQFFDRSPIDAYALCMYLKYEPPPNLLEELERIQVERVYEDAVFFMENLGYCEPTAARRITFEESLHFERIHEEAFHRWGYQIIKIPALSIPKRAHRILGMVAG
jgi:predicted ATPase